MKEKYTYIYDGSFDGFLCCVYTFYKSRDTIVDIKTTDEQIELFVQTKQISYNKNHSDIVYDAIERKISHESLKVIYYAFLSEEKNREIKILDYIMLGFKIGKKVQDILTNKSVIAVLKMSKKTASEHHKFLGILRFKQINDTLFSVIEPTCNILPILSRHFVYRYKNEKFILYDEKRQYAFVYDTIHTAIVEIKKQEIQKYIEYTDEFEQIWKTYHKTMAIKERENTKCQKNFMPMKYWKNLIEIQ